MSGEGTTSWRLLGSRLGFGNRIAGGHELEIHVTLSADTDDPAVIALIERAARDHGVQLERLEPGSRSRDLPAT